MKMIIQGNLIRLRPATLEDRRAIYEWLACSDLTASMLGPPMFADNPVPTWEEFLDDYNPAFFNDLDPDQGRSFIIETAEGEPAGHLNYNEIDRITDTVELDIWLADSQFTRRGYGTEAIDTLCRYLAERLSCKRVILAPSARNTAAVRAYEKCGFRPTEKIPEGFIPDYFDTVVMARNLDAS